MRCGVWGLLVLAISLAPLAAAKEIPFDRRSARSGQWSDPATWVDGKLPAAGANVQIRPGHVVIYDIANQAALRTLHVAGTLRFSREKSTLLAVGLLKVTPGEQCSEDGFICDAHPAPPKSPTQDSALITQDCA